MTEAEVLNPGARRKFRWLLLLVPVLLIGAYYGVRQLIRSHVDGRVAAVAGRALPAFDLTDRDGKHWRSEDLRGRTVVLNFFRSRCAGCWHEREDIQKLVAESDPERVVVLGVMMDAVQGYPADVTEATLARFGYRHPILMADERFVDAFHGAGWAHVTPITYVADPSGAIVGTFRNPYSLADLRAAIADPKPIGETRDR